MDAAAASGPPGPPGRPAASNRSAGPARLLCLIGYHLPDESMVWHEGYGFAHCRRCRQGIVRSLLSNWVVPGPGLRIVWPGAKKANGASPPAAKGATAVRVVHATSDGGASGADSARRDPNKPSNPPTSSQASEGADDAAVPVIVRGKAETASKTKQPAEAKTGAEPTPPLAVAPDPEPKPIDLLGPHFMGDMGAPPGPRGGMEVFEFDDMPASEPGFAGGTSVAAQRAS